MSECNPHTRAGGGMNWIQPLLERDRKPGRRSQPVIVNSRLYLCIRDAAKSLGVTKGAISHRIRRGQAKYA